MAGRHTRVEGTEVKDGGVKRSECAANPLGDSCYFIKKLIGWEHMTVDDRPGVSNAPRRPF
jgi:hypothetical protein